MDVPLKKTDYEFTFREYCSWPDGERWELIEGVAYDMSLAPSSNHQWIASVIHGELYIFLKNKKCKAYIAQSVVLEGFHIDARELFDSLV